MVSEGKKRKLDLAMAAEGGEDSRIGSTSMKSYDGAKPTKRRRNPQKGNANTDDPFILPVPPAGSGYHTAVPTKSILKPERSSHTTTPPSCITKPALAVLPSAHGPDARPSSARAGTSSNIITSDDEDEITIQGVDRSIEQIEHTGRLAVLSLKERGYRYKQRYHVSKKQVSDLRFETAESLHQLGEARAQIRILEDRDRKLEAENDKTLRDLHERTASKAMLSDKERIAGLVKAKEKAENRWSVYKGQFKKANQISNDLRGQLEGRKNQIEYLETLLAFEERSEYSSMMSERQLERETKSELGP